MCLRNYSKYKNVLIPIETSRLITIFKGTITKIQASLMTLKIIFIAIIQKEIFHQYSFIYVPNYNFNPR